MKIAILGAGLIGLYLGGRLQQQGHRVAFLGRQRFKDWCQAKGLKLQQKIQHKNNSRVQDFVITSSDLGFSTDPAVALKGADLVLVCTKATQNGEVQNIIAQHVDPSAEIIILQNGVGHAEFFRQMLAQHSSIFDGLVTFNVIQQQSEFALTLQQTTEGPIVVSHNISNEAKAVLACGQWSEPVQFVKNIEGHKWSKLILNLNNAVNALSGLPIKAMLEDKYYRRLLALSIEEAILVLKKARPDIALEKIIPLPLTYVPTLLRLPTFLFKVIAKKMISIDPHAKSSMLVDLEQHRDTEIDYINGEILKIAGQHHLKHTDLINHKIVELIKKATQDKSGSPQYRAKDLLETNE